MDGIIVIVIAVIFCGVYRPTKVADSSIASTEKTVANVALNPEMTHDEHAFMEIANVLGFH